MIKDALQVLGNPQSNPMDLSVCMQNVVDEKVPAIKVSNP